MSTITENMIVIAQGKLDNNHLILVADLAEGNLKISYNQGSWNTLGTGSSSIPETFTELKKFEKGVILRSNPENVDDNEINIDGVQIKFTRSVGESGLTYSGLLPPTSGNTENIGETRNYNLPEFSGPLASLWDDVNNVRKVDLDSNNDTAIINDKDSSILINSTDGTSVNIDMSSELTQRHGKKLIIRANSRVDFNIPIKDLDGNTFLPNGTDGDTQLDANTALSGVVLQVIGGSSSEPGSIVSGSNGWNLIMKGNL